MVFHPRRFFTESSFHSLFLSELFFTIAHMFSGLVGRKAATSSYESEINSSVSIYSFSCLDSLVPLCCSAESSLILSDSFPSGFGLATTGALDVPQPIELQMKTELEDVFQLRFLFQRHLNQLLHVASTYLSYNVMASQPLNVTLTMKMNATRFWAPLFLLIFASSLKHKWSTRGLKVTRSNYKKQLVLFLGFSRSKSWNICYHEFPSTWAATVGYGIIARRRCRT